MEGVGASACWAVLDLDSPKTGGRRAVMIDLAPGGVRPAAGPGSGG